MNLNINGKDYELHFGLDFIAFLNKSHVAIENGYEFGRGIYNAVAQIDNGDPTILLDLIQAATATESTPPTVAEIKKYLDKVEDIEGLMQSFLSQFEKAPMTRIAMNRIKESAKELEALVKEQKKLLAKQIATQQLTT